MLEPHVEKLLKQRYYQPGEDWEKLVNRVVESVCAQEPQEFKEKIRRLLFDRVFLPNTPCLANAGTSNNGMIACFTVGPIEDSLLDHAETLKDIAMVAKFGGGCGFTGANIRPKGSVVGGSAHEKGQGIAYGPNWWALQVSGYLDGITQGGIRKMALMYSLPGHHKDIEEFIDLKQSGDESKGYNFNQSIMATDQWIHAAINEPESEERRLFDKAVYNAWNNGEPGLLFYDAINNNTPYQSCGCVIETTNPCCAEGTLVLTTQGYKPVETIRTGDFIATVRGFEPVEEIESHANYPIFKVTFSDGGTQYVTAAHQYHAFPAGSPYKKAIPTRLDQLKIGDSVRVHTPVILPQGFKSDYDLGVKQGILLGDGCYTENVVETHNTIKIATSDQDIAYNENVRGLFDITRKDWQDPDSHAKVLHIGQATDVLSELMLTPAYAPEKEIDITKVKTVQHAIGLLDGLLATDGDVSLKSNHPQIRWVTYSEKLAQNIRNLLLAVGCHGRLYVSPPGKGKINGRVISGNYNKNTVIISGNDILTYWEQSRIAELNPKKAEKIQQANDEFILSGGTRKVHIASIEPAGTANVYDLYCSGSDTWITEGYVQRGCGEQPLPAYLACVLASINVAHDVFWNSGTFDFNMLADVTAAVTQFLDNVGTVSSFPNEKFAKAYAAHRPIGIGVMGLADAFLRADIRYGSEESLIATEGLFKCIKNASYAKSTELGKERGIPDHCINLGRRNITTVSQAPTGSIAFLANCSHGIEPIFSRHYIRTDERGETYTFIHPEADQPTFVEAGELSWREHLDIQVAAQRYVDSGVSKTINLTHAATKEDVHRAFIYAWENGCKGITVYRDGSRQKEVITTGKVKKHKSMRPAKLPADIYSVRPNGHNFSVAVGLLEDSPYEVFVFNSTPIQGRGAIVKNGPRNYDLLLENGTTIRDIGAKASAEEQIIARLISLNLRHGVDIRFIVEQLSKAQGTITSYGASVNRALKQYVNGAVSLTCRNCGSKPIVFREGCSSCTSCGASECS